RCMNHEVHDGPVATTLEYRVSLNRLIAELNLQTIHDSIAAPLPVHSPQLHPVVAAPPPGKLVHVLLSGQRPFQPSICEEVEKLDLIARLFVSCELLNGLPIALEGTLIE